MFGSILLWLLVSSAPLTWGETVIDDMVIIEASENREVRSVQQQRGGRQFFWGMGPMYPGGFVMQRWAPRRRLASAGSSNPCYTNKGYSGTCVNLNACYGLLYSLPKNLPYWALGTKNTCPMANDGSSYGVCCTNPHRRQSQGQQQQHRRQWPGGAVYPGGTYPIGGGSFPGYPPFGGGGGFPGQQRPSYPQPPDYPQQPQRPVRPPQPVQPPRPVQPPPPVQPPQPVQPQPPVEPQTEQPPPVVEQPDESEEADFETPLSRFSQCGVGRHSIEYNDDGRVKEEVQRIEEEHPLKVAGGWPADKNEWPWITMLLNRDRQFCDGSIIDQYTILTAAHCVAQMRSSDVSTLNVRVGAHSLANSGREAGVQTIGVRLVVKHKDFSMEKLHSDIAILKLKKPIKYSATVRAVCLPSGNSKYTGQLGTVVGWGLLSEKGSRPQVLQELTMEIWNNAKCASTYGNTAPAGILDSMLCAGQRGSDSCSGDSGGPFVAANGNRWEQVGVVSWGIGCGKDVYPGVYTRVTEMRGWIDKVNRLYPK